MGKRLGMYIRWLAMGLAAALVLLLALNNMQTVHVSLFPLPYEASMPLFLAIAVFFLAGALCGGVALSVKALRLNRLLNAQRQKSEALENELTLLKAEEAQKSSSHSLTAA